MSLIYAVIVLILSLFIAKLLYYILRKISIKKELSIYWCIFMVVFSFILLSYLSIEIQTYFFAAQLEQAVSFYTKDYKNAEFKILEYLPRSSLVFIENKIDKNTSYGSLVKFKKYDGIWKQVFTDGVYDTGAGGGGDSNIFPPYHNQTAEGDFSIYVIIIIISLGFLIGLLLTLDYLLNYKKNN